jgi:hypothetical protein
MMAEVIETKRRDGLVCTLRCVAVYLPLTLLLASALLLLHRIPEGYDRPYCAENWTLTDRITIVLNCDSPEYLHLAREPQDLLLPTSNRQSRPGLVLSAALLSHVFPSSESLSGLLAQVAGHPLDEFTLDLFSTYLPYLALNLAFVWISLGLFASLTGCRRGQSLAVLLAGALLLFNDVVKAFLFSPNTALLAIVAPLLALWSFHSVRGGATKGTWRLALLGSVVGLGVATYALFLVVLPMIGLALWLRAREESGFGWKRHFCVQLGLVTLLCVLPAALWYVWVRSQTGQFFFSEVGNYSEVVWLWAGLRTHPGGALIRLVDNAARLAIMAIRQAVPALILVALALAVSMRRKTAGWDLGGRAYLPALGVSALCVVFFAIAGIMADRRAYSVVPPVVVLAGRLIDMAAGDAGRGEKLALSVGTAIVVLVQALYLLAKVGPFS